MRLLRWLASRFPNAPLNRVRTVTVDERAAHCVQICGTEHTVAWTDIERVLIRTTDKGPFDDDVFIVLVTADDTLLIPQDALGASHLLTKLQNTPGFDNDAVSEAMGCTENHEFECWRQHAV